MSFESLVAAVKKAGKSPCEKFSCPKRAQCSTELLACSAFKYYVSTGHAYDPIFELTELKENRGKKPKLVRLKEIVPTREIFDSMKKESEDGEISRLKRQEKVASILKTSIQSRPQLQTVWS